jgi:peptidoglycan hydrolase-like protein with peptidoglycan-binding domain
MTCRFHKSIGLVAIVALGVSLSFAAPPKGSSQPGSKNAKSHHSGKKSRKGRARGQQAIDNLRCRQIQEALAREHYMTGQPSGKWDDATQHAMRRYQADQGWQSKSIPDSRALIRLGLGPDHGRLLNPETAMTTQPQLPHGTSVRSTAASTRAATVPQAKSSSATNLPGQSSTASTPVSSVSDASH